MQVVKDSGVELMLEPKPEKYWRRNKKPALHFLHDTPFAADRQLEDQRLLAEQNRNPRLHEFTKMDKLRSIQIAATKGQSRAVAMKANVVNKVVREASGIHNYTIVPPPRISESGMKAQRELLEPETNPLVRAYAQEAKLKPVMVSFGHRPRSASRTFHPATMKFRLQHGQILPSLNGGKTGVGLPVSVLKKVLHAPKIAHSLDEVLNAEEDIFGQSHESSVHLHHSKSAPAGQGESANFNDLFLSKDEQDDLFAPNHGAAHGSAGRRRKVTLSGKQRLAPLENESQATWISAEEEQQKQALLKSKKEKEKKIERPDWDEAHHRVDKSLTSRLALKKSLLNPKSEKPLSELMHRYTAMSVAENQPTIFCAEKQEIDKWERSQSGQPMPVPKPTPVAGRPLYFDPWNTQLKHLKTLRVQDEAVRAEKIAAWEYQQQLRTIPRVDYYPTTVLKQMRATQQQQRQQAQESGSSGVSSGDLLAITYEGETEFASTENHDNDAIIEMVHNAATSSSQKRGRSAVGSCGRDIPSTGENIDEKFPYWAHTEEEIKLALTLAERGDRHALYDVTIRSHMDPAFAATIWREEIGHGEDPNDGSGYAGDGDMDVDQGNGEDYEEIERQLRFETEGDGGDGSGRIEMTDGVYELA